MTNETRTWAVDAISDMVDLEPLPDQPLIDRRLTMLVDPKKVQTWELMVLEQGRITDWMLVFARYLSQGDKLISPDLPDMPIDELTPSQIEGIKSSQAYKALKRLTIPTLKTAATSFQEQLSAGF